MKSKFLKITIILFVLYSAQNFFAQVQVDKQTSIIHLKENLGVLASDEYEGRETTTRGEKLASSFIADKLEKYGVKPFGDNGTYFENFNLLSTGYNLDSKITLLDKTGVVITDFLHGDDFIRSTREFCDSLHQYQSTGIVFAGYGITAAEYEYDDYADLDVKGKTVLVLNGEPYSQREDFFAGDKPTKYSRSELKVKTAKEKGAAGVFLIPDERAISYWNIYKEYASQPSLNFVSSENSISNGIPVFVVGEKFVYKLLDGEKESYEKIKQIIKEKDIPQAFDLNKKLKFNTISFSKILNARNVIGIIDGNDPELKNEYVVVSAHYDHLGKSGTVVNNGADDDGSGTVAVLESMSLLAKSKENKRSILGIFHTGEEKGLFGSKYATENGSFIKNVVADINMDMVGRESVDSLHCIGSDKLSKEFAKIIKDVNSETVNYVLNYKYDDPNDPQRFYYRSDHYNYASKGIPVVFFFDDMTSDYHKPTDKIDKINFEKILKTTILSVNVALNVANLDHRLVVDKK